MGASRPSRRVTWRASVLAVMVSLIAPVSALPENPAEDEKPDTVFYGLFDLRDEDSPRMPSRNMFGMTGLIELPTAEFQPDGEISLTVGYFGDFLRNTLAVTILPGVEVSFRYSVIDNFFDRADGGRLFDRSFDIKIRLIKEGRYWPAVAIGLQDFLGTGIYSGEYVVATKHFGPDFVVTAGVGWGRFAGRNGFYNPVRAITDRADDRAGFEGEGGTPNFGRYFQGPEVSLFGGSNGIRRSTGCR